MWSFRCVHPILMVITISIVVPMRLLAADPVGVSKKVELKQQVEQLIEQLSTDSRSVRIRAEKSLLKLGTGILPLLPPPELLETVSVRETIRRIRIQLEAVKARESIEPSRISLSGTFALSSVLAEIAEQTSNRIDSSEISGELLEKQVEVSMDGQDFWPAIDELIAKIGLEIQSNASSAALKLISRTTEETKRTSHIGYSGPFRIAVQKIQRRRIFGDDENELLRIDLELSVEPRLRPLFLKYSAGDLSIQSTKPAVASFAPLSPEARYEIPLGKGGRFVPVQLDFKIPVDEQPTQISLRGSINALTAAGTEDIAFRNIVSMKNIARRRGGVTVMLQKAMFSKTSDMEHEAKLRVVVSYDTGGPAFESHRTWIFHNRVYLETKEGKQIELNGGYNTALQNDGLVAVEYRFEHLKQTPPNYRFVYEAPTLLINVPIKIEMKNIPIQPLSSPQ